MRLAIADVTIPDARLRQLNEKVVAQLADSIREVGLLNPVTVTPKNILVAGLHRLKACTLLGWSDVPVVVADLQGQKRELAEIDENLIRSELTMLERSEFLAMRKAIYECLHPETKVGGAPGKAGGGKVAKNDKMASFVEDTAAKTGFSKRTIERGVALARDLAPDVRQSLLGTPIADNTYALRALADEPFARQRELLALGLDAIDQLARAKREREKTTRVRIIDVEEGETDDQALARVQAQGEERIACALAPAVKDAIRNTPLADDRAALVGLAREKNPAAQKAIADKLVSGDAKNVQQAKRQLEEERRLAQLVPASPDACVLQGDASDLIASLEVRPDCVVMDPPYGLETHRTREGGQDYADGEQYAEVMLRLACGLLVKHLAPDAHLYVFSGYSSAAKYKTILAEHFEVQENPIIWVKDNHTLCDFAQAYPNKHEYVWFARMRGSKRRLARCVPDVIEVPRTRESTHSAEKPVDLLKLFIEQSTAPGELVLDPFAGSGSTGVAAVQCGRRFLGFEVDEKWARVAQSRCAEARP
jgi:ParB family chromosome partitioning protein